MKILYLNPDPGIPVLGRKGCSTHVREICRALAKRDHEVVCLTACTIGTNGDTEEDARARDEIPFELIDLPQLSWRWVGADMRRLHYNLRLRQALQGLMRTFRPDLIYERYALYATGGGFFAQREGIPHMLEVNTRLAKEQAHRLHFAWLAERWERTIWEGAEALVAVSSPLGEELKSRGIPNERIRVMPMAVDTDRFHPNAGEATGNPVRRDLPEDWCSVIYAGALTAWHGIDMFFEIARAWRDAGDKIKMTVIGGDSHQVKQCRKRADEVGVSGHLSFLGSVPYADVPAHLASADIGFIASTSKFSSPTKMFEYMACGLPTVAPDQPAIREVQIPGETGLLFDPMKPMEAVEAIRELAASMDHRHSSGAEARRRANSHHSWDQNARAIEEYYEWIKSQGMAS